MMTTDEAALLDHPLQAVDRSSHLSRAGSGATLKEDQWGKQGTPQSSVDQGESAVRIQLLGPVEATRDDGTAIQLGGVMVRGLLARLALTPRRVVPIDSLIDDLWGEERSEIGRPALRVHVSRLRAALKPADDLVVTKPPGYLLAVDDDAVDAGRLERVVAAARRDAAAGNAEWAAEKFRTALGLFKGPPLADLPQPFAASARVRLEEIRLAAVEARVDADLASGLHGALVAELDELTTVNPFRERLWAARMLALVRCGRAADALRTYQELRTLLSEELGIDPSPDVQALELAILRDPLALAWKDVVPASTRRRLVFMFTDIEGSTAQWDRDAESMEKALARHDEILQRAVEQHGGRVLKTRGEGDSAFCVFDDVAQAVSAAADVQRRMSAEEWPDGCRLSVRIGLHVGEGIVHGQGDLVGPDVNRTARLRAMARAGQILLSGAVARELVGRLPDGLDLQDLGTHRLRGIQVPEHIHELVGHGLRADFPPLIDAAFSNLPAETSTFVGREAELAEVGSRLAEHRIVTITGVGGGGKSRLAIRAAESALPRFRDGVWLVELGGVAVPEMVEHAIWSALAIPSEAGPPVLETIANYLIERDALLILDNCEHLLSAAAGAVRTLIDRCRRLFVLATSREPLRVDGESIVALRPLDCPSSDVPNAAAALDFEAVQLFAERARAADPTFILADDIAPVVARICRDLDGLPLALELAAARLRLLTPAQLSERLGERFSLLTGRGRTAPERQRTLEALIDWSYNLLDPGEAAVFRRLGVFRGTFSLEAAEIVAETIVRRREGIDAVTSLVDKSLVFIDGDKRLRLLESIRAFARRALHESSSERSDAARAHATAMLAEAEAAASGLLGPDASAWMARLDAQRADLSAALDWLRRFGTATELARMIVGMGRFWSHRGPTPEAWTCVETAVARAHELPVGLRALMYAAAGNLFEDHDNERSIALLSEAIELFNQSGDPAGAVETERLLASVEAFQGNVEKAKAHYLSSLRIAREVDDMRGQAAALLGLGDPKLCGGDYNLSRARIEEAVALHRRLDDPSALGWALSSLAMVLHHTGHLARARRAFLESRAAFTAGGNATGETWADCALGQVALSSADLDEAERRFHDAREARREFGPHGSLMWSSHGLGEIALARGDLASARRWFEEGLIVARRLGGQAWSISWCFHHLGILLVAEGRPEPAVHLLAACHVMRKAADYQIGEGARRAFENAVAHAAEKLGREAFAMAWKRGEGLPWQEVAKLSAVGDSVVGVA